MVSQEILVLVWKFSPSLPSTIFDGKSYVCVHPTVDVLLWTNDNFNTCDLRFLEMVLHARCEPTLVLSSSLQDLAVYNWKQHTEDALLQIYHIISI